MVADKLHEKTAECEGHVDDQPILVAAEIEDHPIVADEIDGGPELALYVGGICPVRRGRNGQPCADRILRPRGENAELSKTSAKGMPRGCADLSVRRQGGAAGAHGQPRRIPHHPADRAGGLRNPQPLLGVIVLALLRGVLHAENDDFFFAFINRVIDQICIARGNVLADPRLFLLPPDEAPES